VLILIELHGGNDGLNTLVPYADERYYQARAIAEAGIRDRAGSGISEAESISFPVD